MTLKKHLIKNVSLKIKISAEHLTTLYNNYELMHDVWKKNMYTIEENFNISSLNFFFLQHPVNTIYGYGFLHTTQRYGNLCYAFKGQLWKF